MKKIIIAVIVLLMAAGLVACADPAEAAVSQTQAEESNGAQDASESSDGNLDIDINEDGGSINISGEDGNLSIQGDEDGMPWPGDKLPSNIPEVPGVTVTSVLDVGESVTVVFTGITEAAATAYAASLQSAGWTPVMNFDVEEGHAVTFNKDEEILQFIWSNEGTGSLSFSKS